MTGFGSAASRLGRPDVGLMTLPEMVDNARRIASCIEIPVIADADTGYGNPVNVIRTVQEYEAAGVAAIHIEDQVTPKKCGHMEGKQLIPASEMAAKVATAVAARRSPEFLIIARTDARAVEGLDAALVRARVYREGGADVLFVEAPQSTAEIETIARAFADVPLLFNYAEGGKTPPVSHEFLRDLGYRLVIFPLSLLLTATAAMRVALREIKAHGSPLELLDSMLGFGEFLDFIGNPGRSAAWTEPPCSACRSPRTRRTRPSASAWPPTAGTTSSRTTRRSPPAPSVASSAWSSSAAATRSSSATRSSGRSGSAAATTRRTWRSRRRVAVLG
jgi:2-methylisocitrate lyase-like PEP mutase family enzyme